MANPVNSSWIKKQLKLFQTTILDPLFKPVIGSSLPAAADDRLMYMVPKTVLRESNKSATSASYKYYVDGTSTITNTGVIVIEAEVNIPTLASAWNLMHLMNSSTGNSAAGIRIVDANAGTWCLNNISSGTTETGLVAGVNNFKITYDFATKITTAEVNSRVLTSDQIDLSTGTWGAIFSMRSGSTYEIKTISAATSKIQPTTGSRYEKYVVANGKYEKIDEGGGTAIVSDDYVKKETTGNSTITATGNTNIKSKDNILISSQNGDVTLQGHCDESSYAGLVVCDDIYMYTRDSGITIRSYETASSSPEIYLGDTDINLECPSDITVNADNAVLVKSKGTTQIVSYKDNSAHPEIFMESKQITLNNNQNASIYVGDDDTPSAITINGGPIEINSSGAYTIATDTNHYIKNTKDESSVSTLELKSYDGAGDTIKLNSDKVLFYGQTQPIEINSKKGISMLSPNGTKYILTVNDDGILITTKA